MAEKQIKKPAHVVGSTLAYAREYADVNGLPRENCHSIADMSGIPSGVEIISARIEGDQSKLWNTVKKESK